MTMRRWTALTVVCALLLAVSITWLLAGMRSQMEVGASCADGGPYVVVNPCPEHSTAIVLAGIFLSFFAAIVGSMAALSVGAPNLLVPYWTFTLGGMAVNFLVDGVADEGGWVWAWIICGIGGLLMALPGLWMMSPWQRVYDREPVPNAPLSRGAWWLVYVILGSVGVVLGSWSAYSWL
jgi:hypothetical protein